MGTKHRLTPRADPRAKDPFLDASGRPREEDLSVRHDRTSVDAPVPGLAPSRSPDWLLQRRWRAIVEGFQRIKRRSSYRGSWLGGLCSRDCGLAAAVGCPFRTASHRRRFFAHVCAPAGEAVRRHGDRDLRRVAEGDGGGKDTGRRFSGEVSGRQATSGMARRTTTLHRQRRPMPNQTLFRRSPTAKTSGAHADGLRRKNPPA